MPPSFMNINLNNIIVSTFSIHRVIFFDILKQINVGNNPKSCAKTTNIRKKLRNKDDYFFNFYCYVTTVSWPDKDTCILPYKFHYHIHMLH